MKALILAGGKGTRLRPYTAVIPKPLMPVGDLPILEIILRQLRHAGVDEVILAVGYMSHLFQAFFEDGSRYNIKISYSFEEKPLGTAGPIAKALPRLGDDFLVMNGDLLTTIDYRALFENHKANRAAATIAGCKREVKIDFGVIEVDEKNRLQRYIEKPVFPFFVSMGVNVLNAAAVKKHLRVDEPIDIPTLMMKLQEEGSVVQCFTQPCYWLDIGRMDDYQVAQETFEAKRSEFLPGESLESSDHGRQRILRIASKTSPGKTGDGSAHDDDSKPVTRKPPSRRRA